MEFVRKNRSYVIAGIVLVLLIIYFATRDQQPTADTKSSEQSTEQQKKDENKSESTQTEKEKQADNSAKDSATTSQSTGNVVATGKLRKSTSMTRGNYMVESNKGNIYVFTKRDYSALVDKDVTLAASGTLSSFKFLGFTEVGEQIATKPDDSSASTTEGAVEFLGTLAKSDSTRGNYVISKGSTKVYVSTKRDYSAWVGKDVSLKASGTLNSFTGAVITQQ